MKVEQQKKLTPMTILIMLLYVIGLPGSIYFSKHSSLTSVKIICSILSAALFISLGIIMHRVIQKMGKFERAIQLQVYSYSYLGFLTFLGIFMVLQESFKFNLDATDAIVIILFAVSLIQLFTTILFKKKYR